MSEPDPYRMLGLVAANLYHLSLGGGCDWPTKRQIRERMEQPLAGDWVYERSTIFTDRKDNVGRLLLKRREFVPVPDEDFDGGGYHDTFWYIETPDGRLARWWNCQFLGIVTEWRFDEMTRHGDPSWAEEALKRHGLEEAEVV